MNCTNNQKFSFGCQISQNATNFMCSSSVQSFTKKKKNSKMSFRFAQFFFLKKKTGSWFIQNQNGRLRNQSTSDLKFFNKHFNSFRFLKKIIFFFFLLKKLQQLFSFDLQIFRSLFVLKIEINNKISFKQHPHFFFFYLLAKCLQHKCFVHVSNPSIEAPAPPSVPSDQKKIRKVTTAYLRRIWQFPSQSVGVSRRLVVSHRRQSLYATANAIHR